MSEPVVDYFETALPDLLLKQQEVIEEREQRAHEAELAALRWDEGVACMQWLISRVGRDTELPTEVVSGMLGEIVVYANVGRAPEWLKDARESLGR